MDYNDVFSGWHKDHGPAFEDKTGHKVVEHSYIPHEKDVHKAPRPEPNITMFEDVPGEMAHLMTVVGLFIYAYSLIGCYIFEPCFVRKAAYALQTVRLFLLFSSILPCVLHWQAFQMFPNITVREFPYVIVGLLIGNVSIAKGSEKLMNKLLDKYKNSEKDSDEKDSMCSTPPDSPPKQWWRRSPCAKKKKRSHRRRRRKASSFVTIIGLGVSAPFVYFEHRTTKPIMFTY
ncbi:hypothetical protein Btru_029084 [Bulinus truncatus]|nr:hypothetical protein Btru_029084 [Bulinus truncatus]